MKKMMRIVAVCALCLAAGLGCGKQEAEPVVDENQEQAPVKKTGNQVLDNIANEEAPL